MSDTLQNRFAGLGVRVPRLLLPAPGVDLHRWAVIACDQHTSEPDYWEEVSRIVGDAPSTLKLVFPEVYLDQPDPEQRIDAIHRAMERYLEDGTVRESEAGFALTVRSTPHVSERRGLMLALDLDEYDFTPGASSLTRATEQTIMERLPPRIRIRHGAPMELPHVMVLIDDPDDLVFGGLATHELDPLYSTQLMLGGGSVTGSLVTGEALEGIATALEELRARSNGKKPFLFAVGDGNHSLATAKQVWEEMRETSPPDHPARYALVEVVNLYDPGLRVEPIHRLVMTDKPDEWVDKLVRAVGSGATECRHEDARQALRHGKGTIGYITGDRCGLIELRESRELPVAVLEEYLQADRDARVDYIHGWDTSLQLAGRDGAVVMLLPEFDQRQLFPTVARRGIMPRKAFSLGEAEEKRYYLEARLIG